MEGRLGGGGRDEGGKNVGLQLVAILMEKWGLCCEEGEREESDG